ncbi:hypothetical protein LAZ67_11002855 [Cordylochernes scorpioides]|uniref:Uncharacterized protein n=1 Tax=Cordylochernes scorpioides TaxID=51811 RepID=A0ABY6L276_9ARAC|nr:hypothetical protein LAZ67_11002855 [Cordylochernes scorpioides]
MLQWPPILAKVQPHQRVQVTKRGYGTFVLHPNQDTVEYPDLPSAMIPVPHSDILPVPQPPENVIFSDDDSDRRGQQSDDTKFEVGASSEPHLLTQGDLNDLVRDLDLSKKQSELLGSRLKDWNLLYKGTKILDQATSATCTTELFEILRLHRATQGNGVHHTDRKNVWVTLTWTPTDTIRGPIKGTHWINVRRDGTYLLNMEEFLDVEGDGAALDWRVIIVTSIVSYVRAHGEGHALELDVKLEH